MMEDDRRVTDDSEENCQMRTEHHHADDGVACTMNNSDHDDAMLGRITFNDFDLFDKCFTTMTTKQRPNRVDPLLTNSGQIR